MTIGCFSVETRMRRMKMKKRHPISHLKTPNYSALQLNRRHQNTTTKRKILSKQQSKQRTRIKMHKIASKMSIIKFASWKFNWKLTMEKNHNFYLYKDNALNIQTANTRTNFAHLIEHRNDQRMGEVKLV